VFAALTAAGGLVSTLIAWIQKEESIFTSYLRAPFLPCCGFLQIATKNNQAIDARLDELVRGQEHAAGTKRWNQTTLSRSGRRYPAARRLCPRSSTVLRVILLDLPPCQSDSSTRAVHDLMPLRCNGVMGNGFGQASP